MRFPPAQPKKYVGGDRGVAIHGFQTGRETVCRDVGAGPHAQCRGKNEVSQVAESQRADPGDFGQRDRRRDLCSLELQQSPVLLDPLRPAVDVIRSRDLVSRLEGPINRCSTSGLLTYANVTPTMPSGRWAVP